MLSLRGHQPEAISNLSQRLLRRAAALLAMTVTEKRNAPPGCCSWQGAVLAICRFPAQAQSANPARVGFLDLLCLETVTNDILSPRFGIRGECSISLGFVKSNAAVSTLPEPPLRPATRSSRNARPAAARCCLWPGTATKAGSRPMWCLLRPTRLAASAAARRTPPAATVSQCGAISHVRPPRGSERKSSSSSMAAGSSANATLGRSRRVTGRMHRSTDRRRPPVPTDSPQPAPPKQRTRPSPHRVRRQMPDRARYARSATPTRPAPARTRGPNRRWPRSTPAAARFPAG